MNPEQPSSKTLTRTAGDPNPDSGVSTVDKTAKK
jgi:hypothetical protein